MLTSFAFAGGMSNCHPVILAGATLCCLPVRSVSLPALAGWVDQQRITVLRCPPSLFRPLMEVLRPGRRFGSVRLVRMGGERITMRHVELYREGFEDHCRMMIALASSEGSLVASILIDKETTFDGADVPVGYPNPDVDVAIVDDDGQPVAAGQVGEIVVTGEFNFPGYWNDPALTETRITSDPEHPAKRRLKSGDLGRYDSRGLLYFLGRKDGQLKVRGHRVSPGEIEKIILVDPVIREVAVVGVANEFGETRLSAFLVVNHDFDLAAFRSRARSRLASHMVPAAYHVVSELPRTAHGKVDRVALTRLAR